VFRLKMGAETPANVKPPVITLRDYADPARTSARKFAPPQLKFMRDKVRDMKELNLVYKHSEVECASPSLILPSPEPDQHLMTVYLYVSNASTIRLHSLCLIFKRICTTFVAQKIL
jgi:hypothetical protein